MFWAVVIGIIFVCVFTANDPIKFAVVVTVSVFAWIALDATAAVITMYLVTFLLSPKLWLWFAGGFYLGKNGFKLPWNL